ncbi:argonaute [Naegleria gruberi]|uniref:Argonaute n=1 Tax=Naegleria gruberi TaxID=5762 RepID=D2VMG4_NAEGR|nr:argonaute [Naegleria gruberi]EFC41986.1 argonaute [Naegleria gruberi]|eukprot:XP_002674730.1 argonaute [Naegleria gruberi]
MSSNRGGGGNSRGGERGGGTYRGGSRGGGGAGRGSGSSRAVVDHHSGGSSSGQFHSSRPSSSSSSGGASSSSSSSRGSYGSKTPSHGGRGTGFNQQPSQLSFGNRKAIEEVSIRTIKIEDLSNVGSSSAQTERPAESTTSRAVVNYFPVKAPEGPFYLYDVKINPDVDSKYFAGNLVKQVMPINEIYLFDGTTVLYTKNPLTKNKETFEKTLVKDKKVYKVTINFARSITSKVIDATTLQFMNIILRKAQNSLHLQRIGRHYYNTNEKVVANIENHHIKILPGALSTTFLGSKGLMLNVDMIYKTLRTDTVYSMLMDLMDKFDSHDRIANEFRNTIVLCTYNQRTVHIDDVDFEKTPKSTFVKKTGEKITFAKYYQEQYKIKVKDMNQPLLKHVDRKDPQKIEYYLPELCLLTGLTDDMRKNHQLMKALKDATGLTPNQRIRQIVHSQQECLQNEEYTDQLGLWGLEINDKLLEVETTVLPCEKVEFGDNLQKTATGASWEVKREKLFKPVKIDNWCVFHPNGTKQDTTNFIKSLNDVSKPIGMILGTPKLVELSGNNEETYASEIEEYMSGNKPSFALVVLFNDQKQRYSRVKEVLCNQVGIISQCVKLSTITNEKGLASKATKVIVQICSKMGGAPWTVPLAFPNKEPTMIIGMDVYHSGEIYKRKKASVAGFVASIDAKISTYFTKCIIQEAGKEIVDELEECMTAALNKFKEKNKILPKHVIFYRDGVGEGQKEAVLEREVMACKKAIMNIAPSCKLNYIVVSKRINTRIFAQTDPTKPTDFTNPQPGTVLDYGVTSQREDPLAIEFYLVAQKVDNGQGTATPTKYHSIFNESSLSKQYLETLSFRLCHNYYNWFGTIRVPSPCMYAHKIASLVGQYTKSADFKDVLNDKLFYL